MNHDEQNRPSLSSISTPSNPVPIVAGPDFNLNVTSEIRTSQIKKAKVKIKERRRELKLVYRILRLISDWTLTDFFSEVTPCHHNEIIDIATLSATIPHRRIIAYWTKASLFKNPISRFILESAGSIPVARSHRLSVNNKNGCREKAEEGNMGDPKSKTKSSDSSENQQALFDATYKELARGGALAIFPEGTSYTLPRIVQVKQGAAQAALGFTRWAGELGVDNKISIVPVGIVYTDKSRYRSRLYVRYGKPIPLESYTDQFILSGNGEDEKEITQRLTAEIEKELVQLTINAPDWHTLYATQAAQDILRHNDREILLGMFVGVSQALIEVFKQPSPSRALRELKSSLLRYHALQYHTGLDHASLAHIPLSFSSSTAQSECQSLPLSSTLALLAHLPSAIAPLSLSLPAHLAHAPGYALGTFSSRLFAAKEEEARSQFKAIFGGLGCAVGTFAAGLGAWRMLTGMLLTRTLLKCVVPLAVSAIGKEGAVEDWVNKSMSSMGMAVDYGVKNYAKLGRGGNVIGAFWIAYLLCRWHARVIDCERFKCIRATIVVLRSMLFLHSPIENEDLKPYLATPPPPFSPYVAKSLQVFASDAHASGPDDSENGPKVQFSEMDAEHSESRKMLSPVSKYALVRHLLHERSVAVSALRNVFGGKDGAAADHAGENVDNNSEDLILARREGKNVANVVSLLRECGTTF
ncbi:hypothetical protein DFH11DRAFT_1514696 [Phellopilus nigrolimitatus]|nr:hypothetical protein DFH11DRAFT_1514696 [Phellopilus nigrolimitatus]